MITVSKNITVTRNLVFHNYQELWWPFKGMKTEALSIDHVCWHVTRSAGGSTHILCFSKYTNSSHSVTVIFFYTEQNAWFNSDSKRLWEVLYCQMWLTTSCLKSRMLCHWLRRCLRASWRLLACWSSWIQRSLMWSLAAACITPWSSSSTTDLTTTQRSNQSLNVSYSCKWKHK